jgi:site-specific DNA-methyltransferase (adenine-specific)
MELWTLVRKPPQGTVAANALQHGTGALNIDGCRVLSVDVPQPFGTPTKSVGGIMNKSPEMRGEPYEAHAAGRWPANVIHDGSDEVLAGFPETTSGTVNPYEKATRQGNAYGKQPAISTFPREGDTGSAARFYYTAKASRAEREEGLHHLPMHEHVGTMKGDADGTLQTGAGNPHDTTARNPHPTVKPLALTQYLATLLLPPPRPDATPRRILTPYSGVGSEVIGALLAGWDDATGIELDPTYADIARARTAHWIMRAHGPLFADI